MKPFIKTTVFAVILSTIYCQPSPCPAQGSLTPPGAPAPTMKSLAQIEPRTPIASAPFTITNTGSYYLTTNLTVATGDAIIIATNGVTLDLNGFTIASTAPSATGYGILVNGGLRNLTILNGFIQGGVTNNGSGTYSGSGFQYGVSYSGNSPFNIRVSGVSVTGCLGHGIFLGNGDVAVVESCTVRTVGGYGICASSIKSSVAMDCGNIAVCGDQVSDSRGQSTGGSYALYAIVAQNSYGSSSSGTGLCANSAQNCYGQSTGSGHGIFAYTAQNCYGYSGGSGHGIFAYTAANCYGYSIGTGTGLYVNDVAIGCRGFSSSGTGLSAYIANSCRGATTSGTAQNITFKYNMP